MAIHVVWDHGSKVRFLPLRLVDLAVNLAMAEKLLQVRLGGKAHHGSG